MGIFHPLVVVGSGSETQLQSKESMFDVNVKAHAERIKYL